jgi:hypothetical protein
MALFLRKVAPLDTIDISAGHCPAPSLEGGTIQWLGDERPTGSALKGLFGN